MNPLISVCMPNYNGEKFIEEAINSVLSQTYKNFELIIVDDVSTDNSIELVKKYDDPRIKLFVNKINVHTSGTVNRAINLSKGEIIAVLHSDDKYEPDFFEEIIKAYNKYPDKKVFVTGVYNYHSDINTLKSWYPYKTEGVQNKLQALIKLTLANNIGNGVNVALHRSCLENTGLFSTKFKYLADYDMWWRLSEKYDFVYIPKLLGYYRIHDSNTTHSIIKDLTFYKEGIEVYKENLFKSKIIDYTIYKKIKFLSQKEIPRKAFFYGIKYKSGKVIRDLLNYSKKDFPNIFFNPECIVLYMTSYFIRNKMSSALEVVIRFFGKLILYPNKLIIENSINQLK